MPKFNYVAMDSRGKETKGTLEVTNQNEAITRVKEMGLFPTKVVEVDKTKEKTETKAKGGVKPGAKKKGFSINIQIPGVGGGMQVVSILVLTELFGFRLELASAFALFLWAITFVAIVPLGLFIGLKQGLDWHSLKRIGREASE